MQFVNLLFYYNLLQVSKLTYILQTVLCKSPFQVYILQTNLRLKEMKLIEIYIFIK